MSNVADLVAVTKTHKSHNIFYGLLFMMHVQLFNSRLACLHANCIIIVQKVPYSILLFKQTIAWLTRASSLHCGCCGMLAIAFRVEQSHFTHNIYRVLHVSAISHLMHATGITHLASSTKMAQKWCNAASASDSDSDSDKCKSNCLNAVLFAIC